MESAKGSRREAAKDSRPEWPWDSRDAEAGVEVSPPQPLPAEPSASARPTPRRWANEAEAEVPRAMAEAFRSGNLGIMDYYRMRNVQADTAMRQSIAQPGDEATPPPATR